MKKYYPLLIVIVFTLASCSGTRNIYFNAQAPSAVNVPNHVQSISLIDRSLSEDSKTNLLEGIITGEGTKQDKLATQIVLDGMNNKLVNAGVYQVNRTGVKMEGSGSGVSFPALLSWERIEELCDSLETDAIISLETYDSDFIVTHGTRTGGQLGIQLYAKGVANVDCGFRFYDPTTRTVLDEYRFSHKENWETGGNTIEAAIGALLNRNDAIQKASFQAGLIYAERILPVWYRVHREYFNKSKGDMYLEQGARMMETNDWDRAIEALEKAVETGHPKTKGRAAHNLAIVHEILGNLETAKEWASDAWGLYGNKRSRDYGYILTKRINQQKIIDEQNNN